MIHWPYMQQHLKEGHPEDKVEKSEEVPSQNNTEQQKMNTINYENFRR